VSIKFSILTPWLPPRPIRPTIDLINAQTYDNWEHLISIDRLDHAPISSDDPRRKIYPCAEEHRTWGNTCRHNLWGEATGDWILYLDDDDILYPHCLERVAQAIEAEPGKDWGYFDILLGGNHFFHVPPAGGGITGGQVFHKKIGADGTPYRWYDTGNYGGDWDLIYQYFVRVEKEPILIRDCLGELPKHGRGIS
jgi:glycosyltransferase involved in cell wall biosynthesis